MTVCENKKKKKKVGIVSSLAFISKNGTIVAKEKSAYLAVSFLSWRIGNTLWFCDGCSGHVLHCLELLQKSLASVGLLDESVVGQDTVGGTFAQSLANIAEIVLKRLDMGHQILMRNLSASQLCSLLWSRHVLQIISLAELRLFSELYFLRVSSIHRE